MNPYDTPSVNIEDENEHFNLSDSIISWMENFKSLRDVSPKNSLASLLPPPPPPPPSSPSTAYCHHRSSAKCIAWNLVRIFGEKQSSETLRREFEDYTVKPAFDLSGNYQDADLESNHSNGLNVGCYIVGENNVYSDEFQKLTGEFLFIPKNQTNQSTVINEENVERLVNDRDRSSLVVNSLLRWLADPNNYNQLDGPYYAANHLVKTILEMISTTEQVDTYNCLLIEVCLKHPESVQIFSPYLTPSACSDQVFLDLYKMICSKQTLLGPNATFALLSKFDLNAYLNANPEYRSSHQELIITTCCAFKDIGKNQEDPTMDLFKRHLQIGLASPNRGQSEELLLVLSQFLEAMDEQVLAPDLWLFYLSIIGLERSTSKMKDNFSDSSRVVLNPSQDSNKTAEAPDLASTPDESIPSQDPIGQEASLGFNTKDVSRLADCQSVFDNNSLDKLIKTICEQMKQRHNSSSATLLELYKDYLEQYGMFMLSVTFMWLKSVSELCPDSHDLIWKQFMKIWYDWVFLTKNCKDVSKSSYSLMVNYFVICLIHMIHRLPKNRSAILRSLLSDISNYIVQIRDIANLELTILQRYLKNLPWSYMLATPSDFGNLAIMSEQANYKVFDLVSHILSQMNTKESLMMIQKFDPTNMARVAERLATSIIYHSAYLEGYKLYGSYFSSIATDDIPRLTNLILSRIEFINLEHSHNNKLLVKLLRCICIDTPNQGSSMDTGAAQNEADISMAKRFERAVIYARFISDYLVDLIKRHTILDTCNKKYLSSVMNNSMQDLAPLLTSNDFSISQKTILYASLLKCCNCDMLESDSRMLLARSVIESNLLRSKPQLVIELVQTLGQFMSDSKILVSMVEGCVDLYRNSNIQQYENVWTKFCLRLVPGELYLNTCIQERGPLALLVYFESLFHLNRAVSCDELSSLATNDNQQAKQPQLGNKHIWSRLFLWLSRLNQSLSNSRGSDCLDLSKLTFVWIRVLVMLESQLGHYLIDLACKEAAGTYEKTLKTYHHHEQVKLNDSSSETEQTKAGIVESDGDSKTKAGSSRPITRSKVNALRITDDHKCLLTFIKQLISFHDSIKTGGLWSYLKSSNRSEHSSRVSVAALAVAFFIADRALIYITSMSVELPQYLSLLRDELTKIRRISQTKLETVRKSKSLTDCAQFIETLIGGTQHSDKVQYREVVQLIRTYALAHGNEG